MEQNEKSALMAEGPGTHSPPPLVNRPQGEGGGWAPAATPGEGRVGQGAAPPGRGSRRPQPAAQLCQQAVPPTQATILTQTSCFLPAPTPQTERAFFRLCSPPLTSASYLTHCSTCSPALQVTQLTTGCGNGICSLGHSFIHSRNTD